MKKFIFTASFFCTGLLGLAFVADFIISQRLRKSESHMLKVWNDIYSGNLQNDVLIMGSCRASEQIDPKILDSILGVNSYNIGIDGRPINSQIIRYDAYRRNNVKPKLIIQNIDLFTLYTNPDFPYEREQFFPYFFDNFLKKAVTKYEKYSFLEKYLPAYRYLGYKDLIQFALGVKRRKWEGSLWGEGILYKGFWVPTKTWDGSDLKNEYVYGEDRNCRMPERSRRGYIN